ncbi:H-2 class II histocompatibility antigen, A-U alpha chain-like [Hippocampus comes]|uniref:H-2 class II histocompatibility antigen, A-U alpha chain-like n=1 Tax=Hippocampus comes TaxID=109280 RepID=UPI00094F27F2|nr:PREDICTED: H-2 class II histocompatibility antigen, A-U alpha chain-like [Hippocampus comes]
MICSLNMMLSTCIILTLNFLGTGSQFLVNSWISMSCSTDTDLEVWTDNGNEMAYTDFSRQEIVHTAPKFLGLDPLLGDGIVSYNRSTRNIAMCQRILAFAEQDIKYPADIEDPPQSVIYLGDELQLDQENTLICLVNHFFPPNIQIQWTKNGIELSEGVSLSQYYLNEDVTFHQLSTLTFTPKEGDIYGCTVEHSALDRPQTTFWEVEFSHPSIGPDVFCGVGLTVAVFGIASGVFWGVKGCYATPIL